MRRDDPRLQIITGAIERLIPGSTPAFLNVQLTETFPLSARASVNTWTGTPAGVAERVFTALYGRPREETVTSPLAQAEAAKRNRDLLGELSVLMSAGQDLESAPWYPCRPGDLVHVHHNAVGDVPLIPAFGETYVVGDAGDGLLSMMLLAHSLPEGTEHAESMVGCFAVEAVDCPVYDLWFEAGPRRLTVVRDGEVVHGTPARRESRRVTAWDKLAVKTLAAAIGQAEQYLERGEPELALARLRSDKPLPPCGAPGVMPEHADCARPSGHGGAHSPDADHVEPPHECPKLPEQLHAVLTVGAKVTDVHLAGLYEDQEAAADHAMGFHTLRSELDQLTERFVKPAFGLPGEMVLTLPKENQIQATGVQLAVVVPLQILPDPREDDQDGYDYDDTGDDYDVWDDE
ncbi:hypothetical protein [Streptomyces adelaidensis]|uniref:hypothetical protein n=1 Tax=Streptomyces adelaidensis TaxID=2796465 RepID=UPI001904CB29|nr:hypothetical protein [Streptomyces adelaidensis]